MLLLEWWKQFQQEAFGEVDEAAVERTVELIASRDQE